MKACVELGELPDESGGLIKSAIEKNWRGRVALISSEDDIPLDASALLVIGSLRKPRSTDRLLLVETIESPYDDIKQLLLQVNAKLGKMTRSDLIKRLAPLDWNGSAKVSRRNLLFGLRRGFAVYSDAPFVFTDLCEARYGCRKCVESCPSHALEVVDGAIKLTESECSRVGLCVSVCPVSAIQLPKFSESAFLGLIEGLRKSDSPKKLLVLTCDAGKVDPAPWMYVEQIKDVGVIGPRLLSFAATSGLSGLIVYCTDGLCLGSARAREAVASINSVLRQNGNFVLAFVEGIQGGVQIKRIYDAIPHIEQARPNEGLTCSTESWKDYTTVLRLVSLPSARASGLGLTNLVISDSCTLCGTCEKNCPHGALEVGSGKIEFEPSSCTGCGYCASLCPENSITLESLKKIEDLEHRSTIFQDEILSCARCGKPLDSAKFLKRVAERVGGDDTMMKYCNSCKRQIAFEKLIQQTKLRPRMV